MLRCPKRNVPFWSLESLSWMVTKITRSQGYLNYFGHTKQEGTHFLWLKSNSFSSFVSCEDYYLGGYHTSDSYLSTPQPSSPETGRGNLCSASNYGFLQSPIHICFALRIPHKYFPHVPRVSKLLVGWCCLIYSVVLYLGDSVIIALS